MSKSFISSCVAAALNIAWYGAMVLLAGSICMLAVAPFVDPPRVDVELAVPAAFRIDAETRSRVAAPLAAEHPHLESARGSLRFSPRDRTFVAGSAAGLIAIFALALWVLRQLREVFRTLRAGQPFVPANATRIRRIGYAVIVGEILRAAAEYGGMRYAMTRFAIAGLRFEARPDLDVVAIICGLILLAIAEVFREGTRLDQEQSLTV